MARKRTVNIGIAGEAGTGKSVLALMVEEALKSKGIEVTTFDDNEVGSVDEAREVIVERADRVFTYLKDHVHVDIRTLQARFGADTSTRLLPPRVQRALQHVQSVFPEVVMVLFMPDARWRYMTRDLECPTFDERIDQGVLEDAVHDLDPTRLPVVFSLRHADNNLG